MKRIQHLNRQEQMYGYLFVMPFVLGFAIFTLGPLLAGFVMSFTDWSILKSNISFVGLKNYIDFFRLPYSFKMIFNTFYFTVGLVIFNLVIATSLALLLNKNLKGMGFYRLAFFTPVITTVVVWSVIWKFILSSDGLMNQLLSLIGVESVAWLFDPKTAMLSVIVVATLKGVGMNMFIILSALKGVPDMYYESAMLEGASKWNIFWRITLPMISGILFAVMLVTVMGAFKQFGLIFVMTKGGPMNSTTVWAYDVYLKAFESLQIGAASASAFLMFFVLLMFSLLQWKYRERWVYNEEK